MIQMEEEVHQMIRETRQNNAPKHVQRFLSAAPSALTRSRLRDSGVSNKKIQKKNKKRCVTYSGGVLEPTDTERDLEPHQISAWCPKGARKSLIRDLTNNFVEQEILQLLFLKTPT